jgi:hypothetical protein
MGCARLRHDVDRQPSKSTTVTSLRITLSPTYETVGSGVVGNCLTHTRSGYR